MSSTAATTPSAPVRSLAGARIFVAGETGMAGRALVRRLAAAACEMISAPHRELDLTDQEAVGRFFARQKPDIVVVAAARVGGIVANMTWPAQFLSDNLAIANNVVRAAHAHATQRLLYIASAAAYPLDAAQPIAEEALLTGSLDPTHEPYAIAKIAGIKLCEFYQREYGDAFFAVLPTNLYGPGDHFDPAKSHVIPALIRKAHEAKIAKAPSIEIWGTGKARRDLLHVDDLARACHFLLERDDTKGHFNIGTGRDVTILELVEAICRAVGFAGSITHDLSKPDGAGQRLLSIAKMRALGWTPGITLEAGLPSAYQGFLESLD